MSFAFTMFANFLRLIARRPSGDYQQAFVAEVEVVPRQSRNRRLERLLFWGWITILSKCAATFWLIETYQLPVNGWWVAAPSLGAAAVCSWLYRPNR